MKSFLDIGKVSSGLAALTLCLLGASVAHAQTSGTTGTLTYSTTALNSMDHHMAYTWKLSGIDLTGKTITGATLTATNLRNWNNEDNRLYSHLLDTARYAGVTGFYDDNPNDETVTDLTDDFVSTRYHNGKDARGQSATWLVASTTADTYLGYATLGTTPYTVTYDFGTYNQLSVLDAYIRNGNDLAFGFDPDCHYYLDGFSLKIDYKTTSATNNQTSALPEPGSLALLFPALPLAGMIRRRKK